MRQTFVFIAAACGLLADAAGLESQVLPNEPQSTYRRHLFTSEQLDGKIVQSPQGEHIGTVESVILDPVERRIAYVVVNSEEYSDGGEEKVIIPWKAMKVQEARPQALEQERWQYQPGLQPGIEGTLEKEFPDDPFLVLDVDGETLENAPRGDIRSRRQAERLHDFFGVSPYWE